MVGNAQPVAGLVDRGHGHGPGDLPLEPCGVRAEPPLRQGIGELGTVLPHCPLEVRPDLVRVDQHVPVGRPGRPDFRRPLAGSPVEGIRLGEGVLPDPETVLVHQVGETGPEIHHPGPVVRPGAPPFLRFDVMDRQPGDPSKAGFLRKAVGIVHEEILCVRVEAPVPALHEKAPVFLVAGEPVAGGLSFRLPVVVRVCGAGPDAVSLLPAVGDAVSVPVQGKSHPVLSGPLQNRPDVHLFPARLDRRGGGKLPPCAEILCLNHDLGLVHLIEGHGALAVLRDVQPGTAHFRNHQVGSLLPVNKGEIHADTGLPAHVLKGKTDFSCLPRRLHDLRPHPDKIPHAPDQLRHPVFVVPHRFQLHPDRYFPDIQAPCDRPRSGIHSGGLSRRAG